MEKIRVFIDAFPLHVQIGLSALLILVVVVAYIGRIEHVLKGFTNSLLEDLEQNHIKDGRN